MSIHQKMYDNFTSTETKWYGSILIASLVFLAAVAGYISATLAVVAMVVFAVILAILSKAVGGNIKIVVGGMIAVIFAASGVVASIASGGGGVAGSPQASMLLYGTFSLVTVPFFTIATMKAYCRSVNKLWANENDWPKWL
jgi:hypothetical protein